MSIAVTGLSWDALELDDGMIVNPGIEEREQPLQASARLRTNLDVPLAGRWALRRREAPARSGREPRPGPVLASRKHARPCVRTSTAFAGAIFCKPMNSCDPSAAPSIIESCDLLNTEPLPVNDHAPMKNYDSVLREGP